MNKDIISTHSFDVFDTCISRSIDNPKNLFALVGEAICPKGLSASKKIKTINQFSQARILAEKRANAKLGNKKSAHFDEIYKELKLPKNINLPIEKIKRTELDFEEKLSYQITKTFQQVDSARKNGLKIIFISDMYLDHEFIKLLLKKHNLLKDGDSLYVSSTYGCMKRSGELFDIVLEQENISPHQLLHHGDDVRADIIAAKAKGIKTKLIDHRWKITDHSIFRRNFVHPTQYILNSIPRKIELETSRFSEIEYKYFSLFAPLLLSFTLWTLEQAKKMHFDCLYFISRDGEIVYKIAKIFSPKYPGIEIKYLYGSREAWILKPTESEKKNNLLSYLKNEGLLSDKRWAIVDSGWALNNQKALQETINKDKSDKISGFYFGISNKRASYQEAGTGFSFSGTDFFFPKKAIVIESLIFGSNTEKTIAYESASPFSPIFLKSEKINPQIRIYNDNLHFFVEKYAKIVADAAINTTCIANYGKILLEEFKAALKDPDIEFLSSYAHHLVQKIYFTDLLKLATNDIETSRKIVWLEGSGKISGKSIFFWSKLLNSINIIYLKIQNFFKNIDKHL